MIRVLHVLPGFDPTRTAEQVAHLAQHLPAADFDMRAIVWGDRHEKRLASATAHRVSVLAPQTKCEVASYRTIFRQARAFRPNLIHSWLLPEDGWKNLVLSAFSPALYIASWRDPASRLAPWSRSVVRRAGAIVAPTCGLAAAAVAATNMQGQAVLIPDGAVLPAAPTTMHRDDWLAALGLPPNSRVVAAAGRWRHNERWSDLVWAADLLKVVRDDVYLLLLSYGDDDGVRRFCRQVRVADRVQLRPMEELSAILPHAEVFWSMDSQAGISAPLLAALASGVPVVATDTPCHREAMTSEVEALLVPIGDRACLARQTLRLLDSPEFAGRLANAARDRIAATRNPSAVARRYAQLYMR